ncbi:hypothetical protein PIB30_002813 [Stylosanthes scabra]|uniref:Rapid ALkalinization Factor n=1 Tax=Stylosanthes scabra TaxID=79078 RepID=A0ABU6T2R1_9FABA|nr:hypothetical protein [Stylosanthes scabra]
MGNKNYYSCHLALMVTCMAAMLAAVAGIRTMKASSSSLCNGTIKECMESNNKEFEMMNSEMNKGILESKNKVTGYGAIKGDGIPCRDQDSTSKNCKPGPAANPYNRGCNAINRCRGGGGGSDHGSTHG